MTGKKLNVRTMAEWAAEGKTPEILFWVGCAGSFDSRAQKVTKAFCKVLQQAGIEFGILGTEESCTGDPARRAGNEFIFQMLALQNIQTLNAYDVKKIVTACPHCFNTIKNEYPELGGNYDVIHHTQLLKELIEEGRIKVGEGEKSLKMTYHDSCYLGRINGEFEAPRKVIEALNADFKEMKRSRRNGLCCGAGGAQMFKEDEPGNKRVNTERVEEALELNPDVIVANCPFCITMLSDGLKEKDKQEDVMIYDLSELIVHNNKW
ncbi:MAG: (Fe-S)-binding protein [Saprospirales bacterium]|nr:MAG: (Fe-S)-binding protein [Saprospirales bacterium]